jgi:hypothetical protein
VLWDIDGTLVQAGQGRQGHLRRGVPGGLRAPPEQVAAGALVMTGRTDHEITLDFLASHRIAGAETHLPAFSEALVADLAAKQAVIRERGRACPASRRRWPHWRNFCSRCSPALRGRW